MSAQRVNGGVMPWRPEACRVLGYKAQIQLCAGSLTLNDVPATNVRIVGSFDHYLGMLNTVGADMARGALTGV
ncbi:hypothetical protein AIZ04_25670, partial [Salmonella enterica subsp. enterica serovar Typhimurium]